MTTDDIKAEFFRQNLEQGLQEIIAHQRETAQLKIYGRPEVWRRTGSLMDALQSPDYTISAAQGSVTMTTNLPEYTRFLDMKGHGNIGIYNRQIWRILYGETMQDIRYGFREWLRQNFPAMLEQFNAGKF